MAKCVRYAARRASSVSSFSIVRSPPATLTSRLFFSVTRPSASGREQNSSWRKGESGLLRHHHRVGPKSSSRQGRSSIR